MSLRGRDLGFVGTAEIMATSGLTVPAAGWVKAETTLSKDGPRHRATIFIENNSNNTVFFGASGVAQANLGLIVAGGVLGLSVLEKTGDMGTDIFLTADVNSNVRIIELG